MKYLLFLLVPFTCFAQSRKSNQFIISGTIKGLPDSTMVFLARAGNPAMMVASDYAKGGKFVLFGAVDNPDLYQVNYIGFADQNDLFLSPSKYTITGDVKLLKKAVISGPALNKEYQAYINAFGPLKDKLDKLVQTINQMPASPKRDTLINQFETNRQKVITMVEEMAKAKPASPVSAYVLYVTSGVNQDMTALEARYNLLTDEAKETVYGREILKAIMASKIGMEGTQAVDFTQTDTANVPVSLSSFKGKYVLVDFWASWCGPCRMENPNVLAAYNAYKDKNFTVLGVSLDQSKERWINAIHADNLAWTHVSDLKHWQNEVAQLYHIQGIPANMLIDPSGKIVARNLRGEALQEALGKVLKQ